MLEHCGSTLGSDQLQQICCRNVVVKTSSTVSIETWICAKVVLLFFTYCLLFVICWLVDINVTPATKYCCIVFLALVLKIFLGAVAALFVHSVPVVSDGVFVRRFPTVDFCLVMLH